MATKSCGLKCQAPHEGVPSADTPNTRHTLSCNSSSVCSPPTPKCSSYWGCACCMSGRVLLQVRRYHVLPSILRPWLFLHTEDLIFLGCPLGCSIQEGVSVSEAAVWSRALHSNLWSDAARFQGSMELPSALDVSPRLPRPLLSHLGK